MFRPKEMSRTSPVKGLWHGAKVLNEKVCSILLTDIFTLTHTAPLRRMKTPTGGAMQVQMSNCGEVGWVSDASGYRYDPIDPMTGKPWPPMPPQWQQLAGKIALRAEFPDFVPDVALINRYTPGTSLGLHQDNDEVDLSQPIVSVSMGYRGKFVMGGLRRNDRKRHIPLEHGDVLVFGGRARLNYHGLAAVVDDGHPMGCRWNITFRKAL